MERKNVWLTYKEEQLKELEEVCIRYKTCLDEGKTERECVKTAVKMAEEAGYRNLQDLIQKGETLKPQDKVYVCQMEKSVVLYHLGERSLEEGMNILGAHIDSPRVDVKQVPLYEDTEFAYLDGHYYGGIKKYQWVAIPLAIHGVVAKKDGSKVDIVIGEKEDDPVFAFTDLLIHLSAKQMEKTGEKIIEGEQLDLLFGNRPLKGEKKEAVKSNILRLLKESYDMEEEDFLSAELEIVPAGKARDCGIDGSMIMGYGHDDRVCAFTSLMAMLELEQVEKTACCILIDKEEIGSAGATSMESRFFENSLAEVMELREGYSELKLRRAMSRSRMLSSDVSAAYDPMFGDVFEKRNAAYFANGIVFNKYTGSKGKSRSNDANAEYMAVLRAIMERNDVAFQTAELGKIDAGGGGTIALILANYGMEVIDSGVAVLCMHAPWEIVSKADVYEAVKCYRSFLKEA